jgi:hypothetical protein
LGFLIGPAISGLLAKYDYRYPIFAAAALAATASYHVSPVAGRAAGRADEASRVRRQAAIPD